MIKFYVTLFLCFKLLSIQFEKNLVLSSMVANKDNKETERNPSPDIRFQDGLLYHKQFKLQKGHFSQSVFGEQVNLVGYCIFLKCIHTGSKYHLVSKVYARRCAL